MFRKCMQYAYALYPEFLDRKSNNGNCLVKDWIAAFSRHGRIKPNPLLILVHHISQYKLIKMLDIELHWTVTNLWIPIEMKMRHNPCKSTVKFRPLIGMENLDGEKFYFSFLLSFLLIGIVYHWITLQFNVNTHNFICHALNEAKCVPRRENSQRFIAVLVSFFHRLLAIITRWFEGRKK